MRRNALQTWVAKFIVLAVVLAPILHKVRAQEPSKQTVWPDQTWKVARSPETAGWSSERLAAAKAYGDSIHTSAVMIVQGGEVVDEWGDLDKKLTSYSIRKSLISALYGIYSSDDVIGRMPHV